MDTLHDDTIRPGASGEDAIVLGIASTDTQGGPLSNEDMGGFTTSGISAE